MFSDPPRCVRRGGGGSTEHRVHVSRHLWPRDPFPAHGDVHRWNGEGGKWPCGAERSELRSPLPPPSLAGVPSPVFVSGRSSRLCSLQHRPLGSRCGGLQPMSGIYAPVVGQLQAHLTSSLLLPPASSHASQHAWSWPRGSYRQPLGRQRPAAVDLASARRCAQANGTSPCVFHTRVLVHTQGETLAQIARACGRLGHPGNPSRLTRSSRAAPFRVSLRRRFAMPHAKAYPGPAQSQGWTGSFLQ